MIGNDIVDLALARTESNLKRKNFLDKLFTKEEQLLVENANNPEVMVWNLWSRKEAAYKIYNRETGIRGYFPKQLVCSYESETSGTVCCNERVYYTKSTVTKDFIYTIATIEPQFFNQIEKINLDYKIHKTNGIPSIIDTQTALSKPVSITHHGRFWEGITI
jgi:phosphopantetheinyl transferase (holo-ACP synthase)